MDIKELQRLKATNEACKIALELHDKVAQLEAKLERAMKVVEAARDYRNGDGDGGEELDAALRDLEKEE